MVVVAVVGARIREVPQTSHLDKGANYGKVGADAILPQQQSAKKGLDRQFYV
jgi:hypothetical protein